MRQASSSFPLMPLARALAQLDDPVFLGVAVQSVVWSLACFALLHIAALWAVQHLLNIHGILAWTVDILGSISAALLTLWLFLPVAAAIGTFYFDRIALAVERRFYPGLPPPLGAPVIEQVWDGIVVCLWVLALNVLGLVLALTLPGVGFILGWLIAAFAIGRGLFVAVAMRRMPRTAAAAFYRSKRSSILLLGAILAAAAYIPLLNLLIPVIGTAAMIHILDTAIRDEDSFVNLSGRRLYRG